MKKRALALLLTGTIILQGNTIGLSEELSSSSAENIDMSSEVYDQDPADISVSAEVNVDSLEIGADGSQTADTENPDEIITSDNSDEELLTGEADDSNENLFLVGEPNGVLSNDTSLFFYNQLSPVEQSLYNQIKTTITTSYQICPSTNCTEDQANNYARNALIALISDDPMYHLYYTRLYQVTEENGNYIVTYSKQIYATDINLQRVRTSIDHIAAEIGKRSDRYTTLRTMWNYFADNIVYDELGTAGTPRAAEYNDTGYGIFLNGAGVCAGFAEAVKIICDRLAIPCIVAGNGGHAWNMILMEDGKWYNCDFTSSYRDEDSHLLMGHDSATYIMDSRYAIGNTYLWAEGDFAFPATSGNDYQYSGGSNSFEYEAAVYDSIIPDHLYEYYINEDKSTCTITEYVGESTDYLVIPEMIDGLTVTGIGEDCFLYSNALTGTLVVPASVKTIGKAAFRNCRYLKKAIFNGAIDSFGSYAFAGCESLSEVMLPSNLSVIPAYTFKKSGLKEIVIPSSVKIIEESAFENCSSLESVVFNEGLQEIKRAGFYLCKRIESLHFPDSLVSLDDACLAHMRSLRKIYIPAAVRNIGAECFQDCEVMEEVTVSELNEAYSSYDGCLYNKAADNLLYVPAGKTSLHLSENLKQINENCLQGSPNIKNVFIPKNVSQIADKAFYHNDNLSEFIVDEGNSYYASFDGAIYNKSLTELVSFPSARREVTRFPETVKYIHPFAFFQSNIESITIPESISSIGEWAFDNCAELKTVTLSHNMSAIPKGMFSYSTQIKDVYIPESILMIDEYAFEVCSSLANIYYEGTKDKWNSIKIAQNGNEALLVDGILKPETVWTQSSTVPTPTPTPSPAATPTPTPTATPTPNPVPVPKAAITGLREISIGKMKMQAANKGTQVDGYQFKWSLDSSFNTGVKSASSTKHFIFRSGLIGGKTYYVKARTYKIINGKKVYSTWSGTKSLKLNILPPKPAITSLSKNGTGFTVKWKAVSGVGGYQIRYSTASNFSPKKTASVAGASKTSWTKKNLVKGQTYYVSVRSYKVAADGTKYYSKWSIAKSIVIR